MDGLHQPQTFIFHVYHSFGAFHVDVITFKFTMQECCFNIHQYTFQMEHQHAHHHDSICNIIHNWCIVISIINSRNLTVSTSYQSCSVSSISFDVENPFVFHTSSSFRYVSLLNFSPHLSSVHVFEFLSNCFPPKFSFFWVLIVPSTSE